MEIAFTTRENSRRTTKNIRTSGRVPVVCYGAKTDSAVCSVSEKDLRNVVQSDEVMFQASGDLKGKQVVLKEIQYDSMTQAIIHADFLFVDATHTIDREIPITLVGEAPALKRGGLVEMTNSAVDVRALPQNLPGHIEVNIDSLAEIGDSILASDLSLSSNVELLTPLETPIVVISAQVEEVEEVPEESVSDDVAAAGKSVDDTQKEE